MAPDTVIIDLDGTLADVRHRLPFIRRDRPDYPAFFSAVSGDELNVWCRALMRALKREHRVVIVSGRPDATRADTEAWLATHDVPFDELHLVRGADEMSVPDHDLKRRWVTAYGKDRILFAVDDRQKVVDMWRAEGIVCLQCDAWPEFRRSKGDKK